MPHQGDSCEVIRVRTRETLARPDIAQLVLRGARACGFPTPSAILAELCLDPGNEKRGIFIGTANGTPRVVILGGLPSSPFELAAMVGLAYSEGASHALFVLVSARLREWFQENGHNHADAMNLLHPDPPYLRALAHFGRPRRVGSVIEFRFD